VGDRIGWFDDGETIRLVPVPSNPIRVLRGSWRGQSLLAALLNHRRQEREHDR